MLYHTYTELGALTEKLKSLDVLQRYRLLLQVCNQLGEEFYIINKPLIVLIKLLLYS